MELQFGFDGDDFQQIVVAGVDEVGRGPLAGPVIAAAVILPYGRSLWGLDDSKLMTPRQREAMFKEIQGFAIAWSIGRADVFEIEKINILQASLLAMKRAVSALPVKPDRVVVDGNVPPDLGEVEVIAIVKGDQLIDSISAASIVAKVIRDREMDIYDYLYSGYGFAQHKGYSTAEHLEALQKRGPCPIHRRGFSPVKNVGLLLRDL